MAGRSKRASKDKKTFIERSLPYATFASTAAAVAAVAISAMNYAVASRQAITSERSFKAANRNTEMARLLTALRDTCIDLYALGDEFHDGLAVRYNTNFNLFHPEPMPGGAQRIVMIADVPTYPDTNKPKLIAEAAKLADKADKTVHQYEIVQLYLTEDEAKEAESSNLVSPFEGFALFSASIANQELSSRRMVEAFLVSGLICNTLPKKLAAWFRNSDDNKLDYVLRLEDVQFQWAKSEQDFWLIRDRRGPSLEERDEMRGLPNPLRWNNVPVQQAPAPKAAG
ncbi:hypothetical protein [Rhizobium metallidurans]|uniref:Uncharacterized protein n=1 Tax=Rhizobium metallidurans TaxID=1265931 RepID=A0A7W6CU19_9HYPH|nr:hypothetical protein [Rhizobium metallidurans]MBB3967172.1 hypothetical protein [Rhizobium metallidurans]